MTTLLDLGKGFLGGNPNQSNAESFGKTNSDTYIRYGQVTDILEDGKTAVITLDGNDENQTLEVQPDTYFELGYRVQVAYKNGQILAQVAGRQNFGFEEGEEGETFDPSTIYDRLTNLETWRTTVDSSISGLNAQYNTLNTNLGTVQTSLSSLQNQYNTLNNTVSNISTNVTSLRNGLTALQHYGKYAVTVRVVNQYAVSSTTSWQSSAAVHLTSTSATYSGNSDNISGYGTISGYGWRPPRAGYWLITGCIAANGMTGYEWCQIAYGVCVATSSTNAANTMENYNYGTSWNTNKFVSMLTGRLYAGEWKACVVPPRLMYITSTEYVYLMIRSSSLFEVNAAGTYLTGIYIGSSSDLF